MDGGHTWYVWSDEDRARWPDYAKYREASCPESYAIGSFLDWFFSEGYGIETSDGGSGSMPVYWSVEKWICLYYGIDYDKAMQQREEAIREALAEQRELNRTLREV